MVSKMVTYHCPFFDFDVLGKLQGLYLVIRYDATYWLEKGSMTRQLFFE